MSSFNKNLIFNGANESGNLVNLAITNDFILRNNVQKVAQSFIDKSLKKPDDKVASGFFHLFEKITDYISCVDLAFCNLETPLAKNLTTESSFDENGRHVSVEKVIPDDVLYYDGVYCFVPFHYLFNVHPAFALSLKKAGWNIVNTANNHSLDRLSNGIDKTIESLEKYSLDYVGMVSYKKLLENNASDAWDIKPYKIKEINGIKIAFFGITRFINKNLKHIFKSNDGENQVCNFGKGSIFSNLNGKNIPIVIKWFKHAKDIDGADFIIVFAHWGFSFFDKRDGHSPDFLQRKWSKQLFDGGADLIIGGHTHTIQPGFKYVTKDGRQCFVAFSLGNFITEVKYENKLISSILYITLDKNKKETFIKKVKYLPTYSLKKIKDSSILDLQVVPVDKHKHLFYLYDKYNRILGKNNLITSQDIEKEYFFE
jgi:poly-gamma-glutamate synthesis protein (capsule biosynthesis protein)